MEGAQWIPEEPSPYHNVFAAPIVPDHGLRSYGDDASSALLWRLIEKSSEVRELGISRFYGDEDQKTALWTALRGLVLQAHHYFRAAGTTESISAALLYYYCFMNLAKAELLLWKPELMFDPVTDTVKRLHHGISFDPSRGRSFQDDSLTVRNGIFHLLYEKRIGSPCRIDKTGGIRTSSMHT